MMLENDDNFNTIYDVEFEKIPFIFRFGKKRAKVAIGLLIVQRRFAGINNLLRKYLYIY